MSEYEGVTDVTITMVGYISSGKTSYLLGMYHQMQLSQAHFTLRTADSDDSGVLEAAWKQIANGAEHHWPLPNANRIEEYDFKLDYGFEPFASLRWIDYDGERMAGSQKLPDVQELMKRLEQSTCVFLTVPGEYLSQPLSVMDATEKIQAHRMNELMGHLARHVHPSHEKPLPVAIVITKYDLCVASGRESSEIIDDVKALFNPLFAPRHRFLFRSPSYLTAICPVTLGVELANDKDRGITNPKYVQDPVFFAAWATLWQRLKEAQASGAPEDQIADMQGKLELLAKGITRAKVFQEGEDFDVLAGAIRASEQPS